MIDCDDPPSILSTFHERFCSWTPGIAREQKEVTVKTGTRREYCLSPAGVYIAMGDMDYYHVGG
jgi:hypothetical protein